MNGAASSEDQPDDVVTVESDAPGRKGFDIEPENADAAKHRRYTRSEVDERIDRIAESLGAQDPLMQQLTKNPVSPALPRALSQNASMMKFATAFMGSSPAMTALAGMTRPYDKIARAIGPKIPMGIDWASVVPPVSAKFAGSLLGAGLMPSAAKGLGVVDGVNAIGGLGGTSSPFAKAQDDLEERFAGRFAGALPASSLVVGRSPVDLVMPDLPPNPAHETNQQLRELLAETRAERDQMQRERDEEKARDAAREVQRGLERKADRRTNAISLTVGVVGALGTVAGIVVAIIALR